jgi:hypothetical protein
MQKACSGGEPIGTGVSKSWDSYPYGPEYVRAGQIARSSRTQRPLIDISLATWWRWVKSGEAPQPIRLSKGTTVWRLQEVIAFAEGRYVK